MIKINLDKAKELVAHPKRRELRSEKFKPVDGDSAYSALSKEGEAIRSMIKAEDDKLQLDIDNAKSEQELKEVLDKAGIK